MKWGNIGRRIDEKNLETILDAVNVLQNHVIGLEIRTKLLEDKLEMEGEKVYCDDCILSGRVELNY